jgi:ribonuclease P protein component
LNSKSFSFGKEEKLCSQKKIAEVFTQGKVVFSHPLRVSFIARSESIEPTMFLVSVPKRNFKKAVHRNQIKRHIRESIRLNKTILLNSRNKYDICIVYTGKKIPESKDIDKKIKDVLGKIKEDN